MALVEPLMVVEVFAVESVVDTEFVVVAAVVVLSASSSFEIVVVFPLGTAVDQYAVVVVAFSCSTGKAMGANVSSFMSCSFCSLMKLNCKQLQNDSLLLLPSHNINNNKLNNKYQGVKKIIFTACHSDKLKLTFTSPDISSTSPKSLLKSRIDLIVLELFEVVIPRKRSLAHRAS